MSIKHIKAEIVCDGCGCHFSVAFDEAYEPPEGWSLYDVATDTVRGGTSCEAIGRCEVGVSSVQGNMHLCPGCTRKADNFIEEDRPLTDAELLEAIGR
jgi:uncharacterized Fe-S cluster-containing MiaB family protein